MTKKKSSLLDIEEVRKPLRAEPETKSEYEPVKKRVPLLTFTTRITEETEEQIKKIAVREGWNIQEVIRYSVDKMFRS